MASLTFSDLQTRVLNQLRIPTSNTEQATRVGHIINEVYRDVAAKYEWYWLQDRTIINTSNDYITGTVSVTKGSTSATFSTAPTGLGSFAGRVLVVDGGTDDSGAVYRISAHTADATAFTLDANYTNQTAAAATFHVYQDYYDLPTDFGRLYFVKRYGYWHPLDIIGPREMHELKEWDVSEGKPLSVSVFEFDTSGDPTTQRQLVVHPYPDDTYRLEVYYKQTLNTEVTGSTRFHVPDDYVQILLYGSLARAYPIMMNDVDRGLYYTELFNSILNLMTAQQREVEGNPQIAPRDNYRRFYRRGSRVTAANADLGSFFDRFPFSP